MDLDNLMLSLGKMLFTKFLTDKEYREKLMKDMEELNEKLDKAIKVKEEIKEASQEKKDQK